LSTRGEHVVASNSGHWIPLDNPQAVIDAVNAMVARIRQR
jgi:pimeloyl-ACP methyl ester carboxylesterase